MIAGRDESVRSNNRGNHFALLVEGIRAWETHLKSFDVIARPLKQRPDGYLQIFVADPDGHFIELCSAE